MVSGLEMRMTTVLSPLDPGRWGEHSLLHDGAMEQTPELQGAHAGASEVTKGIFLAIFPPEMPSKTNILEVAEAARGESLGVSNSSGGGVCSELLGGLSEGGNMVT